MTDRTRIILEDLEAVRENLLALSDDIWLSIDHNDPDALEEGVAFKRTYNEKLAAFDSLATELSILVQQFTSVNLEAEEQTGGDSESENRRIIHELDREEPHGLEDDFTYKRPHGFILQGRGTTGITTRKRLFELLCKQLLKMDSQKFRSLMNQNVRSCQASWHGATEKMGTKLAQSNNCVNPGSLTAQASALLI